MDIFALIRMWLGLTMAHIYLPVNIFVMFCLLRIITRFSASRAIIVSCIINAIAILAYSIVVWATNYDSFLVLRFDGKLMHYFTLMSGLQLVIQGILLLMLHTIYPIRIRTLLLVTLMSNFYTYLCLLFLISNNAVV
jgi:hypothetical protein